MLMLIFAPLLWGGNDPLPRLALELAALGLAGGILWRPAFRQDLSWPALTVLSLLVLVPLVQLIPVPLPLWTELPGRAFYAQGWSQLPDNTVAAGWRAISIVPIATENAWLTLLPPVMVFAAAVGLAAPRLQKLAAVLVGLAVFEALLGIIQVVHGPDSLFRLGNIYYKHSAVGTYINRNHLAGLLEMALPVALALLAAAGFNGGHSGSRIRGQRTLRSRLVELTTTRGQRAIRFGAAAVVILAALILTGSRAGIALGVAGVLLCLAVFPQQKKSITVVVLAGLTLAALTGLEHVVTRFMENNLFSDGRWPFLSGVVALIREFFPLGSGGGSFEAVYHRFYPDLGGVARTLDHAHNDYLEGIVEHGLTAIIITVILLGVYLRRWPRVWQQRSQSTFGSLQAGAGVGLLLMALHSVLDFNLHIPANAVMFAFLAAVFFHRATGSDSRPYRRRRTVAAATAPAPVQPPLPQERVIPPENLVNPFNE